MSNGTGMALKRMLSKNAPTWKDLCLKVKNSNVQICAVSAPSTLSYH